MARGRAGLPKERRNRYRGTKIGLAKPKSRNKFRNCPRYFPLMKRYLTLIAFALTLTSLAGTSRAAVIVKNGSFEFNSINPGYADYWTGNTYFQRSDASGAQNGTNYMAQTDIEVFLQQDLSNLQVAQQYNLSFYTTASYTNRPFSLTASVGGTQVGVVNSTAPSAYQWGLNNFTFTANSTTATLRFDFSDLNYSRVALDNVSVTAVPEPSTYAFFGLGALALVMAYRRRRA